MAWPFGFLQSHSGHWMEHRWEGNKNISVETSEVTVALTCVVGMKLGSVSEEQSGVADGLAVGERRLQ